MPRLPVRIVTGVALKQLFNRSQLWYDIFDGTLTSEPVPRSQRPATNPRYVGGTSQMLIHRDSTGRHVCTTHRVVAVDGTILHWDESDIKLPTETLVKAHH